MAQTRSHGRQQHCPLRVERLESRQLLTSVVSVQPSPINLRARGPVTVEVRSDTDLNSNQVNALTVHLLASSPSVNQGQPAPLQIQGLRLGDIRGFGRRRHLDVLLLEFDRGQLSNLLRNQALPALVTIEVTDTPTPGGPTIDFGIDTVTVLSRGRGR